MLARAPQQSDSKSSTPTPSVSVVMPVRNALPYLDESIASILNQTFKDFEFVILDDASTDGSTDSLREWASRDARIRLYESRENLGPSSSSNFVVGKARAPLIARMDADDISHPERLRRQLEVTASRPDAALLATLYEGIDARGRHVRPRDRWRVARASVFPPFAHGSIMFRREAFDEVGGYRIECAGWEDQDLFLRMRQRWPVVVLGDTLYSYRFQVNSVTGGTAIERSVRVISLRQRCLAEFRRGRDYTRLLAADANNGHHAEALADTLLLRGSVRLWAGHAPEILVPLWRHKRFGLKPHSLRILAWAVWAAASPSSLRFFLRSVIRTRDFVAGLRVKEGGVYEWRLK